MRDVCLQSSNCPLLLFDPEAHRGQLLNPATGLVELDFPRQESGDESYPLHEASILSPDFACYLHYLVTEHILFTHQTREGLACVEDEADMKEEPAELQNDDAACDLEFSSVWFRAPLTFSGLSGLYDRLGFCFLNGALYAPMYCDVIETRLRS